MLAKERGYVTTPALLESFIARLQAVAGAPPEPERPESRSIELVPAPVAVESAVTPPAPAPVVPESAPVPVASTTTVPAPASVRPSGTGIAPASASPESTTSVVPPVALVAAATSPAVALPPTAAVGDAPLAEVGTIDGKPWMSRVVAILAALVVLEGAAIAWLLTRADGPALTDHGELVIQTRPVAARVTIDGEERGITPYSVNLSPGPHILEVRVGRSEPRVIPVQIRAGVQSGMYVELQSVATVGALDVRSDPARARVTVDGQSRGTTPVVIRDLPPGDHEVVIEAGERKVKQTVRIEPGVTSQLVVPLTGR
jgi:hypothetical protein